MKKRLMAVLLTVFVLMITGCGNSNSADEQNGADRQIADNIDQTDTAAKKRVKHIICIMTRSGSLRAEIPEVYFLKLLFKECPVSLCF